MKKNLILIFIIGLCFTSCYEDYTGNNDVTTVYFSSQKPLRTVISNRDMSIKVGVAIGGKRKVDMNDWAKFEIDPSLLEGTSFELLPEEYYSLSDDDFMKVSRPTLSVADVEVHFTEEFYNNPNSVGIYYALPFKLVDSSLDKVLEGKAASIVAIKYISNYHGYYYIQGKRMALNNDGTMKETIEYGNINMSQNEVRLASTINRNTISREGIADWGTGSDEKVEIEFLDNNKLRIFVKGSNITFIDGSGMFTLFDDNLQLTLDYTFKKGTETYQVQEILTRRQDPLKDLRYEEW